MDGARGTCSTGRLPVGQSDLPSIAGILFVLLVAACQTDPVQEAVIDAWSVDPNPLLLVTSADAPAGLEFAAVTSARRMRNGRVLVANTGAYTILVFDSTGRFLTTAGRKGMGPGEFSGTFYLLDGTDDSVAVWDAGTLRWTMFDSAIRMIRATVAGEEAFPAPAWVYRGTLVTDAAINDTGAWAVDAIDAARSADPAYDRLFTARRDDLGFLWINDPALAERWLVYDPQGAVAMVDLPAGLALLQAGADFIVGQTLDSLEVEEVGVYALRRTGDSPRERILRPAGFPHEAPAPLGRALLGVMTLQEQHYADHGRYASAADGLRGRLEEPFRLFLLHGDHRRWAGVAVNRTTGHTCGVSIGQPGIPGWTDGMLVCGR